MTISGVAEIVYPDEDGMPIPDGEYQAPLYVSVVGSLDIHFRNRPDVRVNGNVFIYYIEGDPSRRFAPDCYVLLNFTDRGMESIRHHNTYLLWEVGKAPDFILEIGSESTTEEDLGSKRDLYAELGVTEYWRYDETGGDFYGEPLVGERLVDGEYQRIELRHERDGSARAHSDVLDLDLWWTDGELRFWDPAAGRWLLSHEEAQARADDEYVRAEEAQARADNEQARADYEQARADDEQARAEEEHAGRLAAEARVAELEAELRRLRGE